MGTKSKKLTPWEEVTKNLTKEELENIGTELECMMAGCVREEIDKVFIDAIIAAEKGEKPDMSGISPMNIPDTPEWNEWAKKLKKSGDIGIKLLKYESKNQKTKR